MRTVPMRHKSLVSNYLQTHELPRQFTNIEMESNQAGQWKDGSIKTLDRFFAGDNSERDEDPAVGSVLYDMEGTNAKLRIELAESDGEREAFHQLVSKETGKPFEDESFSYFHQSGDEVHRVHYEEQGDVSIAHGHYFNADGQGFFSTSSHVK